jgi:Protein of unknown function (DUF3572)
LTKEERFENRPGAPMTLKRNSMTSEDAELLAVQALVFMASDDERLSRFAAISGLDAGDIQAAARAPGFLAGVLAHLLEDEELLVAFAQSVSVKPVMVPLAYRVIPGGDPAFEINVDAWR